MYQQTHRFARFSAGLSLAALVALSAAVPAFASDSTGSATVSGGTLDLTGVPATTSFSGVTIDGTPKASTASLPADVNDKTGSGSGWRLSVKATQFSDAAISKSLAANALTITAVDVACKIATECSDDVADRTGLSQVVGTSDGTLLSAASNTGMGSFASNSGLSLAIPANTYAGTYASTITVTVASAP